MYRRLSPRQVEALARKVEAMRRGRDRARMEREPCGMPPELPELRRVITVIDYDTGAPVTHTLQLLRTERIDTYAVVADGRVWKRCGWSDCLVGLRKAYQRLPSPRSDFWW